jgi:hypothetical protein
MLKVQFWLKTPVMYYHDALFSVLLVPTVDATIYLNGKKKFSYKLNHLIKLFFIEIPT